MGSRRKVRRTEKDDAEEQRRLHEAAAKCVGAWKGGGRARITRPCGKSYVNGCAKSMGGEAPPLVREGLSHSIDGLVDELAKLLASPRRRFSALPEADVPCTAGLYVIYSEDPLETIYVGKASLKNKPRNRVDGLCFRIMKNHLAYQGDDNFVQYIVGWRGFVSRVEARGYIRASCSVHWIEVEDPRRLFRLEHLAIAALNPRLNRG